MPSLTRLNQVLTFTNVAPGGTVALPHEINVNGVPVKPDLVFRDNGDFAIVSCTTTVLTVQNTGGSIGTLNAWLNHQHTIDRAYGDKAVVDLSPQPFIPAAGVGSTATIQELTITPAITPPALPAGETDDYDPPGFGTTTRLRQATDPLGSFLSGLAAQNDGDVRIITNLGPGTLTLEVEDTSSLPANRFLSGPPSLETPGASLEAGGAAIVIYSGASQRWQILATAGISKINLAGFNTGFNDTRIVLRSLTPGSDTSIIRWLDSNNVIRYSMGNDFSSNGLQNFWLFDNITNTTPMFFDGTVGGVSNLRFGPLATLGRIRYNSATHEFLFATSNIDRMVIGDLGLSMVAGQVIRVGGPAGPLWASGAGTPEGVVTAPIGSLFSRTDGTTSTTFYVKEAGAGNTGWVAK